MVWPQIGPVLSVRDWLDWLRPQDPGFGLLAATAGLLLMFYGWRIVRLAVLLSAAGLGAVVGDRLATLLAARPFAHFCLVVLWAVCLAILSWPSLRVSTGVLGGLATMFAVTALVGWTDLPGGITAVVVVAAALLVASLAFVLLEHVVIFITSLEGAILLVSGCVILMTGRPSMLTAFRSLSLGNPLFVPLTLIAPTVIGFFMQLAEYQRKDTAQTQL